MMMMMMMYIYVNTDLLLGLVINFHRLLLKDLTNKPEEN